MTLEDLAAGVKSVAAGTSNPGAVSPETVLKEAEEKITETPVKGIRKVISDRMLRSLRESAPCTLHSCASAVWLREIRERLKAADASLGLAKISINDLILTAVSRVPYMNAHTIHDPRTGEALIRPFERVHLGVAVDTPGDSWCRLFGTRTSGLCGRFPLKQKVGCGLSSGGYCLRPSQAPLLRLPAWAVWV